MSPDDTRELYRKLAMDKIAARYTLPEKPSSDGYYHLWLKDENGRRQIKAKTIEELKEKIYIKTVQTFKEVFERVLEEKLKYVKNKEKMLSVKNTIAKTRCEYRRFFENTFIENMNVDEIGKEDVEEICYMNLQRYELTPKGFLGLRGILKQIFKFAYENYMSIDNVYQRIDFNKYKDMLMQPTPIDERVHDDSTIEAIIKYAQDKEYTCPSYFPAYALELQIAMGLRRGEIPPLKWADVRNGYIEISKEQITVKSDGTGKEYFQIVNHTKTYKNRRFPITREVDDILVRLSKAHKAAHIESEYLFPADTETGVITNNTVYQFYRRGCHKLNIPISKECIKGTHSFRRNAITKAVNNSNGNILLASKLYGNTPEVAENNYYTGIDMEQAKNILESAGNQK